MAFMSFVLIIEKRILRMKKRTGEAGDQGG
jgi:hypothetical protein